MSDKRPTAPLDYTDAETEFAVDFRQYLRILWTRKWLIVATTVLAVAIGAVQLKNTEAVYSSKVRIKYDTKGFQYVNFSESEGASKLDEEMQTQIQVIQSPRILSRVIDALGLYASHETPKATAEPSLLAGAWGKIRKTLVSFEPEIIDPEIAREQRQVQMLRESIDIAHIYNTRLIDITVDSPSQQLAPRIASEIVNQYRLSLAEDKSKTYGDAKEWFDTQLDGRREALQVAESKLADYEGESDIKVVEQNYTIASESMNATSRNIEEARNRIAEYEAIEQASGDETLQEALLAQNEEYASIGKRYKELSMERVTLVVKNTVNHPDVQRIDSELAVIKAQMSEASSRLLADTRAKKRIAELELASLGKRIDDQQSTLQRLQKELIQYGALKREVEASNMIFTALLDKSKEIDVSATVDTSQITVLDPATVPEQASSPRVMRTLLLFLLLGFAFGTGLVLVVHKFDRSIKEPREVESQLRLPTLGVVPYLRAGGVFAKRKTSPLLTEFDPKSNEAESFRMVRTALQYSSAGQPPRILLVTSCFPQEGKSTVAMNLAISFSQKGMKTLLIDGDLKAPTAHRAFDKTRVPGLSDVLTGQELAANALRPSGIANLDIVTAGHAAPSPGDLLESQPMEDLVADLRTTYETIVIDSAPLTGMADTMVLARMVDGICLVVSRGKTPMDGLAKAVLTLDSLNAHILGVIYNSKSKAIGRDVGMKGYGYGRYGYAVSARD